jgi:hypothetical protein
VPGETGAKNRLAIRSHLVTAIKRGIGAFDDVTLTRRKQCVVRKDEGDPS